MVIVWYLLDKDFKTIVALRMGIAHAVGMSNTIYKATTKYVLGVQAEDGRPIEFYMVGTPVIADAASCSRSAWDDGSHVHLARPDDFRRDKK